jgi:hypothetical protein
VQPARSGCPINAAVEAFGDSWSLLVLRDVMFGNRRYFRELMAGSEEGIASNILADRLKRLVNVGLLTREEARGRRAGAMEAVHGRATDHPSRRTGTRTPWPERHGTPREGVRRRAVVSYVDVAPQSPHGVRALSLS